MKNHLAGMAALAAALVMAAAAARAENPLRPGDDVVPFRHFDGAAGRIVPGPAAGYEGTCWRVLAAERNSVSVALVNGEFRPHWEGGKSFTAWFDTFVVDDYAPFPSDAAARQFSVFEAVEACPTTQAEVPELTPGERLIQHRHFDRDSGQIRDGADPGEGAGCWEVAGPADEGVELRHLSGVLYYWWMDGEPVLPGGSDAWFSSEAYRAQPPSAVDLPLIYQIFRPVPDCPPPPTS
jgi:hypothetical protein